ncbi:MAG: TlyA family RNA methyltransferase [Verrucomicrobiales bacterium]|jgi:23S rRNA (cytidine1920-2'-O)/16S rRNA (cytidine1409-2'-O)-methyltransferase|nr:TlyA family RNA methyltransferase [Verrucomicrobiales bacterium]MBP9222910.1 TlyA family RNA methyltransferase [Verrucomicrobiales bacterium]HQZ29430.1 TlyA family RNA methyltransferase [Verrucomicrobiales bacterium]
MGKERLDQLMHRRGLCDSREMAKRLIIAGEVRVDGHEGILKPGLKVDEDASIEVKNRPKFVSRGGFKIEKALDEFGIDVTGLVVFDAGASTGGFTDCVLQRGAAKVYAYDVGTNQLAWKIRSDVRVISQEGFNIRYLQPSDLPEKVDLVMIDVSFISLTLILGPVFDVLKEDGSVVALIKPQFELKKEQIGKGGIVRDSALHEEAVEKIRSFVAAPLGKSWKGVTQSPISGTDGNIEFLAWLKHEK